jgi:hypothetical protein
MKKSLYKYTCIIFILLNLILIGSLQELKGQSASCIAYWLKNESQTYRVKYKSGSIVNGDSLNQTSIDYRVKVTILDASDSSYIVSWDRKIEDMSPSGSLELALASTTRNFDLHFVTDEFGVFIGPLNQKEIRRSVFNALQSDENRFPNPEAKEIYLTTIEPYFNSTGLFLNQLIPEIQQFCCFNGIRLEKGKPLEASRQIFSSVAGALINGNTILELLSIDTANATIVIHSMTNGDPDESAKVIWTQYSMQDEKFTQQFKTPKEMPPVSITEEVTSAIHSKSGWPLFSLLTRENRIANRVFYETIEMELD